VKHRHLLPDEIDQLLDDELGFGMAPLKAHLSECDDCRGRYEDARAVTNLIDTLPHLVPSHRFAENVMSKVDVFVPWHVTARDTIAAWVPAAGRSRKVAVFAAAGITGVLTLGTLALATQSDLLVFASDVLLDRTRDVVVSGVGSVVVGVFGAPAFDAVARYGTLGFAAVGGLLLLGAGGAFASLRALAATASRRRG
jgi:predicted anti-sigma-YlaC factor YlaD